MLLDLQNIITILFFPIINYKIKKTVKSKSTSEFGNVDLIFLLIVATKKFQPIGIVKALENDFMLLQLYKLKEFFMLFLFVSKIFVLSSSG